MSTNKKITDLPELTELNLADDDVLAIVDVSAGTTNKVQKSVLASALSGVSVVNATSPIAVNQTTGEVTVSISSTPSFGTVDLTADTSTGDTAAVGYTSAEGIIITGQGSSNDITLKNDADAVALKVPTGTTNVTVTGVASAASFTGSGAGLTAGTTPITTLDIDGGTDIGAAIVDADLFIIDDGASGTNRKTAASRLKTYIGAGDVTGPGSATDNTAARFDSTTGKLIQGSGVTIDDSNNVGAASLTLTTDLAVEHGGTGASTLTDGAVLLGSGTGAITAMAVLADGEMIVGDGTTDPVAESGATLRTSIGLGTGDNAQFTNLTATGAFTSLGIDDNSTANRLTLSDTLLTSVEPIYSGANSMIATGLHVETGASGMATAAGAADDFVIEGSANTGMSILSPAANSQHIFFGDANANDIGRINYDHSIDDMSFWTNTVERVTISSAGEVTTPTQPSFQGRSGTLSNVTGDGTNYTILFPTERFDVGANFASPTYTAPVTGKYLLTISMELRGLTSSHTDMLWHAVTSNLTYSLGRYNPYAISVSGIITANGSMYVDMDAADTMTITVQVNGGTKVVDIDEAFWSVALIG